MQQPSASLRVIYIPFLVRPHVHGATVVVCVVIQRSDNKRLKFFVAGERPVFGGGLEPRQKTGLNSNPRWSVRGAWNFDKGFLAGTNRCAQNERAWSS